ncbi:MAG TPA: Uma2 family endonuclease [Paenibacillus sp.]|nr:Uma2 family endonuclease [Paenibacillus sp.]
MQRGKSDKPVTVVKEQQQGYMEPIERYEIIGGVRYDFMTSPKYEHQKILQNFHLAFHGACAREGEVMIAPLDVHFDEENVLQPDVIYIRNERLSIIRDGYIYGVPDLVVEVLSASTGRRDKTIKKATYERFGVKEYWLADPAYRVVDQYVLDDGGKYAHAATLTEDDKLRSPTVPCLEIDLGSIFPPEKGT